VGGVGAGGVDACAFTSTGALKCWGFNGDGALGDNTTTNSAVPVDVVDLSSGVVSVSLSRGDGDACALTSTGAVKCWGDNAHGQLGDDMTTSSAVPVDAVGLSSGVVAISVGRAHACALTSTGAVKCWGYNGNGQLGDDTIADRNVPVDVVGLSSGVISVSAGGEYTCALTSTGAVKCWGYNASGQLGDDTTTDSHVPVDVVGLSSGVVSVSAGGSHTCIVT
jgi:alpha-tubulin suppressor-like RCC1 family protein